MQTRLVSEGALEDELPSYLVECIVFNVPDVRFGEVSYLTNFRNVLSYIRSETREEGSWNDWVEVHGLKYLFRGSREWNHSQVYSLADRAWSAVGLS